MSLLAGAARSEAKETAAAWKVNGALREAELGNLDEARRGAVGALALAPGGRMVKALAGLAFARAGDLHRADSLALALARAYPSDTVLNFYWLPTIRAAIELHRDNPRTAIEVLQATSAYEMGGLYPAYVRAEAHLRAQQGKEAAAEYQQLLDHPGIVLNAVIGVLARVGLARAYALQGDTARARTAYQEFLALWKDAEPDIPMLVAAKAEYSKLK